MKANCRKWKGLFSLLSLSVALSATPMNLLAENKKTEEVQTKKVDQKAEAEEVALSAGAAVLLNMDITMADEEIVELVKSNTTEAISVKTLTKKEDSTLVMAKVNEYVNIREEADQDSKKLGVLYKDCGGHIVESEGDWTKIQSGDVTGWVKNEYLYFGEEAQELAKEVGILTAYSQTETLRVRKEPGLDAGVLGLLSEGEAVEAIAEQDEWVEVSYEGTTGYVSAEYVKVEFDLDVAESMEEILAREAAEKEAKRNAQKEAVLATASELDILAALIQCEAGSELYDGQIAVGAVVMNRVRSGGYPNTITDVIYASGQFTPASTGRLNSLILSGNIKESCRQAAQAVVSGTCNVGDALHFRRVGTKEGIIIGNHVFW
ncbi:MAG: SH3 domain-containing protein [Lachnospiraceae bacterium]|nr:SH3 domain-containing protein [Lachnospiraceae bacterium]